MGDDHSNHSHAIDPIRSLRGRRSGNRTAFAIGKFIGTVVAGNTPMQVGMLFTISGIVGKETLER
jgi:hypothetical protein